MISGNKFSKDALSEIKILDWNYQEAFISIAYFYFKVTKVALKILQHNDICVNLLNPINPDGTESVCIFQDKSFG